MSTDLNYYPFRFHVDFSEDLFTGSGSGSVSLCSGAFSEITGLEASMEPKVIKEGGRSWGAAQRAGQVNFTTIVLKRGMTQTKDLWKWFELVGSKGYAYRLAATITMFDNAGKSVLAWKLDKALPIKFKSADLNAKTNDVAIEELHLAHEGLSQVTPPMTQLAGTGGAQ